MTVTLSAPETVRKAVGVRLVRWDYSNYQVSSAIVAECNLHNWKPYAAKLDWSALEGCNDFSVFIVYDDGSDFPLVSVINNDCADYTAFNISSEGLLTERSVSAAQIVPMARLFLSVAVTRDKLTIGAEHYEQVGVILTKKPATLRIVGRRDG